MLFITGTLLFSGCSQNLVETDLNLNEEGTTTVKVAAAQIQQNQGFSAQSFVNGTVNDISAAKITVTQAGTLLFDKALNYTSGAWSTELTLPTSTELQFVVSSSNDEDREIFRGTTLKTLQITDDLVTVPQEAIEDGATNLIPQIVQIARPQTMSINSTANISFTIASSVTGNLTYEIMKDSTDTGTFTPKTGSILINSSTGSYTFDVSYYANQSGDFNGSGWLHFDKY